MHLTYCFLNYKPMQHRTVYSMGKYILFATLEVSSLSGKLFIEHPPYATCFSRWWRYSSSEQNKEGSCILSKDDQEVLWVWMFMFRHNSYVENLMPKVIVLAGRAFGWRSSHEREASMNGIRALIKGAPKRSLTLRTQQESTSYEPRREPSPNMTRWCLGLGPTSRPMSNTFLLLQATQSVHGIFL